MISSDSPSLLPLRGLRILVTRPAGQHQPLCSLIEQAGGQAIFFPVLAITPLTNWLAQPVPRWDLLIFISANAAQYAAPTLLEQGMIGHGQTQLAAVGWHTAQALRQFCPNETVLFPPVRHDSEGLLALPALQARQVQGQRVAIVRGRGGRETLAETLRARGAQVEYVEVYARTLPAATVPAPAPTDIVTLTSVESAENLFRLLPAADWLASCAYAVFSARVRDAVRALGAHGPCWIASAPGDEALLAAITQAYRTSEE